MPNIDSAKYAPESTKMGLAITFEHPIHPHAFPQNPFFTIVSQAENYRATRQNK